MPLEGSVNKTAVSKNISEIPNSLRNKAIPGCDDRHNEPDLYRG